MRIFVVDDEENIRSILKRSLEKEGFLVSQFENGRNAYESVNYENPDLIVLDWDMPVMSGIEFVEKIRQDGNEVPVIFLTINDKEEYRIEGLEKGADDYIGKPFSIKELITRVHVVLRRYHKNNVYEHEKLLQDGDLVINLNSCTGKLADKDLQLTVTEFRLLEAFLSNPGQVFSRDKLLDISFPEDNFSTDRAIDSHIKRLRKKIGIERIETVYGLGYKYIQE